MPLEPIAQTIAACRAAPPAPGTRRYYSLRRTAAFTTTAPPDPKPLPVIPRTVPAPMELCEGGYSVRMPDGRVVAFDAAIYCLTREGGAK